MEVKLDEGRREGFLLLLFSVWPGETRLRVFPSEGRLTNQGVFDAAMLHRAAGDNPLRDAKLDSPLS